MAELDLSHRSKTSAEPVRALLEEIIDYAGLFPPAALSLEQAVAEFAAARASDAAWLLARFVLPTSRLEDMRAHMGPFHARSPLRLSVLAGDGDEGPPFLESLERDLSAIGAFRADFGPRVRIEQIEFRVPPALLDTNVISLRRFLSQVRERLPELELRDGGVFLELPPDQYLHQTLPIVTGACAAVNRMSGGVPRFGVKMRTGGTDASAFPHPSNVAYVIGTCHNAGVPLKATAGLHHPLRHRDDAIGTMMHGFLNVFAAAALTYVYDLDESIIGDILADEDADSFSFDHRGLHWRDYSASPTQVGAARHELALSFGSCSFRDPVADLQTLGLLDT